MRHRHEYYAPVCKTLAPFKIAMSLQLECINGTTPGTTVHVCASPL